MYTIVPPTSIRVEIGGSASRLAHCACLSLLLLTQHLLYLHRGRITLLSRGFIERVSEALREARAEVTAARLTTLRPQINIGVHVLRRGVPVQRVNRY